MITIQQLTKKFGNFTALDGLSLDIRSGCIYGIVGPNGSGKSTLLRLIAGVYRADGGQVLVDGEPAWENVAKKDQVFYLSGQFYLIICCVKISDFVYAAHTVLYGLPHALCVVAYGGYGAHSGYYYSS